MNGYRPKAAGTRGIYSQMCLSFDVSITLVFDTTPPRVGALRWIGRAQGDCLKSGWLRPCHGSFTPVRISHSRPPCVIPISLGAGTGRKYPPAEVMAKQPTTSCFQVGRGRSAPSLAVIDVEQLHTGGHGAPSFVASAFSGLLPVTCSGSDIQFSRFSPGGCTRCEKTSLWLVLISTYLNRA